MGIKFKSEEQSNYDESIHLSRMWMDANRFKKKRCGVSSVREETDDTLQLIYGGVHEHE